jgi:hypothetical protein
MESAVERGEISQAPHGDVRHEESSDRLRARRLTRQFDDIPSVVRALLTGYDEA